MRIILQTTIDAIMTATWTMRSLLQMLAYIPNIPIDAHVAQRVYAAADAVRHVREMLESDGDNITVGTFLYRFTHAHSNIIQISQTCSYIARCKRRRLPTPPTSIRRSCRDCTFPMTKSTPSTYRSSFPPFCPSSLRSSHSSPMQSPASSRV